MYIISSDTIEVKINPLGAEIEYLKINGINILWKRSNLWDAQSPILFPIIGGLKDGFYFYEGKRYELGPHGFAKSKKFEVAYLDKSKITLINKYDEDTLLSYPFKYELRVTYLIVNNQLEVSFEVVNLNDSQISFSIGIHPGFSYSGLNQLLGNFELKFNGDNPKDILFSPSYVTKMVPVQYFHKNLESMTRDLEIRRTICYEGINSLELYSNNKTLKFVNELSYIAFWQKNPNNNPEFICIEGWEGIPDFIDTDHNIMNKIGNIVIKDSESFIRKFKIEYEEN